MWRNGLFISLCLYSMTLAALENTAMQFGNVQGYGWQAQGVTLKLSLPSDPNQSHLSADVHIDRLQVVNIPKPLRNAQVHCQTLHLTYSQIHCQHATFNAPRTLLSHSAQFGFTYDLNTYTFQLNMTKLPVAKGMVTGSVKVAYPNWQARLHLNKLDAAALYTFVSYFFELPQDYSFAGHLIADADLSNQRLLFNGKLNDGSFSDSSGLYAGEGIKLSFKLNTRLQAQYWAISQDLHLQQGEVLANTLYLAVTDQPIRISNNFNWYWQRNQLSDIALHYQHQDVLELQLNGSLGYGGQTLQPDLQINLAKTQLNTIYQHYLKSYLDTTGLQDLHLSGTLHGQVAWHNQQQKVSMFIDQVDFVSKKQGLQLDDLNGEVHWRGGKALPTGSYLRWRGGNLLTHIQLGKGSIHAVVHDDSVSLLDTMQQQILDGELRVETFDASKLGTADMQWTIRTQLKPISLPALSQAFGLPALQGKVSAMVPEIRYQNKQLDIGGALLLNIFDGEIVLKQLQLNDPFGQLPIMTANIEVNKINLQPLTEITGFGDIQGQLSGQVNDLYLLNWQPIAFDAYFQTPKDNTLPRKISQKAVNSLYSVGGNTGAVNSLSQGVLSLFSAFSYETLGWGCTLKNNVCIMRGAVPAANGYYIVKGGGLPRIDVIGYNQQVDWSTLLTRLKRVTQSNLTNPILQ